MGDGGVRTVKVGVRVSSVLVSGESSCLCLSDCKPRGYS
jgi:hypothetical protein